MAGPLPVNVKVQGVHEKLSFSQKFSKYCEIVLVITLLLIGQPTDVMVHTVISCEIELLFVNRV